MHAVYIHIPFCRSICSYCDFCKVYYNKKFTTNYLKMLEKEIISQYNNELISTIYIGGGTPSSLDTLELKELFRIIKLFKKTRNYEFSFECNIEDISSELLQILKENGVNRLSIGIESFNKKILNLMNRHATYKDCLAKINLARTLGFNNINVDLMYAMPKETMFTLRRDIHKIIKLNPEHISTYSLILEKNTILYNKGYKNIKEEKDAKMYNYIKKILKKHGYNHYEISNFAKEGLESKHNTTYWLNEEYYGFGCGASGYIGNIRYENTKSITSYLKGEFCLNKNLLSRQEEMDNEIMLVLRLLKGLDLDKFYQKYQVSLIDSYPKVKNLIKEGLLILEDNHLKIPEKYIYIMDSIVIKII
mgnify:CR=1 FL=1